MKLCRFGAPGKERPGALDDRTPAPVLRDAGDLVADFDERFFAEGGVEKLRASLDRLPAVDATGVRFGPPVARPSKIIAVGVNYREHAGEQNLRPPESPVLFSKATTAIVGPTDDIVIPRGHSTVDFEVELALVVGRRLKNATKDECVAAVAGYAILNDVSERTVQVADLKQWFRGKSFDTFAPFGPFLVPARDVGDPQSLDLSLSVNGEVMQSANTRLMIFTIGAILEKACAGMTLLPGDVVSTGTPDGVGKARTPPRFLKPGDVVEAKVEKLGAQKNRVVADES